jgi:cell division protein FtsL
MAGKRRNQSAAIRFGSALKAAFLCLLIAGSAVGYVWQKSQIYQLGQEIRQRESRLTQLRNANQRLADQLAALRSPVMLDQRVRQLNLGLVPAQPAQVRRLPEPSAPPAGGQPTGQLAARLPGAPLTP